MQSNYTQRWWNASLGWGAWYTRQFPVRVDTWEDVRELYELIEANPITEWQYRERDDWGYSTVTREHTGYLNWRTERTPAELRVALNACHREQEQAAEIAALKSQEETAVTLTNGARDSLADWKEHDLEIAELKAQVAALIEILNEVLLQLEEREVN